MQTPAQIKLDSLTYARIDAAAHEAATGHNLRPQPSQAQQRAGNFKKGRAELHGIQLVIEHPRGTYRCGVSADGVAWSNRVAAHYGYLAGTRGADGDPVDVFVGPFPESAAAWVINQRRADGAFDEHKVMLGFHTEDQARAAYTGSYAPGWAGLQSIVPIRIDQLRVWLRGGPSGELTPEQLNNQSVIMDRVNQASTGQPVHFSPNRWMYALRAADAEDGLLLDAVTMDELMGAPEWEGRESQPVLDALVVEVGRLQPKMDALLRVMQLAGQTVKPVSVSISEPVRARGVLNVMALFLMDDGQTVSLWLHNPDATPSRLAPMDELISWRWMLNKRDVTIVVAPERGIELDAREVARRLMRLVDKNSAAFSKANERAAERAGQLRALDAEIVQLTGELGELQHKIEVARVAFLDKPKQALAPIEPGTPEYVAWEDAVTTSVEDGLQTTRSDAQGQVMLYADWLNEAFEAGITPENAAKKIVGESDDDEPEASTSGNPGNLTDAQMAVLIATKGYKPAFRFQAANRETRTDRFSGADDGISRAAWDEAVGQLNAAGAYLRRSALTDAGRTRVDEFHIDLVGADRKLQALSGRFALDVAQPPAEAPSVPETVEASETPETPELSIAPVQPANEGATVVPPDETKTAARPSDNALEAQAMAGHEVNGILRNAAPAADGRASRAPVATLGSILLYTEEDLYRAAKAVEDAEIQRDFKPFDVSKVRMPSAAQLGATKDYVATVLTRNEGLALATGWSNGFLLDLHQMPRFIETAMKRRLGDLLNPGARVRRYDKEDVLKRFMPKAQANATTQAEPLALWDGTVTDGKKGKPVTKARQCVVLVDQARAGAYAAIQLPFFAYFFKTYPGCEFYIGNESDMVLVRHRGAVVGIVNPFNFHNRGNVFARAVKAASLPAAPDPITAVDAAYRFASATPEFKRVVAETVNKLDYSAFATAKAMDREATKRGLFIDWDVASDSVLDAVGMFDVGESDQASNDSRAEGQAAATSCLPAVSGAVLDAVAAIGGDLVGTIYRGGDVVGRAEIASGDGKAMVFVGEAGDERVSFRSDVDGTIRKALWSDDDASLMIGWLDDLLNETEDAPPVDQPAELPAEKAADQSTQQALENAEEHGAGQVAEPATEPAIPPQPAAEYSAQDPAAPAVQGPASGNQPPMPAGVTPKDGVMEEDRAYLQTFVGGSADVFADDILARMEPLVGKYEGHPDMGPLLAQAMDAYSAQVMQMAQQAIQ